MRNPATWENLPPVPALRLSFAAKKSAVGFPFANRLKKLAGVHSASTAHIEFCGTVHQFYF
jgi:hypothetical protein